MDVVDVSKIYFEVGSRFDLGWMRATGEQLGLKNHWQKLAVGALIEDLYNYQTALTHNAIDNHDGGDDALAGLNKWIADNQNAVDQTEQMLTEIKSTPGIDFAMLTVASKQLRDMIS
jgi:glutamate dehydrogenase